MPCGFDGLGISRVVGAVVFTGDVRDVLALVAVFCDRLAPAAGEQARSEGADLAAGVVDVVLALDAASPSGP